MYNRSIIYIIILILILVPISVNITSTQPSYETGNSRLGSLPRSTVLINEIMPNPVTEDTGEFVELYNPGVSAIDVSNWYVQDLVDTNDQIIDYTGIYDWGLSGTQIPAGGYCLYVDQEYAGEYNAYLNANADPSKVKWSQARIQPLATG